MGFKHITSSPFHQQSNGLAERNIQTVKNLLKKTERDNKDPYLVLLEYITTPIDSKLPSPVELLYSRKIKGLLPIFALNKKPEIQQILRHKALLKNIIMIKMLEKKNRT